MPRKTTTVHRGRAGHGGVRRGVKGGAGPRGTTMRRLATLRKSPSKTTATKTTTRRRTPATAGPKVRRAYGPTKASQKRRGYT
jgi:hypothetical protein